MTVLNKPSIPPFRLSIGRILVVTACSVLYGFLVQVVAFDFMVTKATLQKLGEVQLFIHAARYALSTSVLSVGLAVFAAYVAATSPGIDVTRWNSCESFTRTDRRGFICDGFRRPLRPYTLVGEWSVRLLVLCLGAEFGLIFALWLAPTVAPDLVPLRGIFARVSIGALSGLVSAALTISILFRVCRRPRHPRRHYTEVNS